MTSPARPCPSALYHDLAIVVARAESRAHGPEETLALGRLEDYLLHACRLCREPAETCPTGRGGGL